MGGGGCLEVNIQVWIYALYHMLYAISLAVSPLLSVKSQQKVSLLMRLERWRNDTVLSRGKLMPGAHFPHVDEIIRLGAWGIVLEKVQR